jgi:hypothetical protein
MYFQSKENNIMFKEREDFEAQKSELKARKLQLVRNKEKLVQQSDQLKADFREFSWSEIRSAADSQRISLTSEIANWLTQSHVSTEAVEALEQYEAYCKLQVLVNSGIETFYKSDAYREICKGYAKGDFGEYGAKPSVVKYHRVTFPRWSRALIPISDIIANFLNVVNKANK